MALIDVAKSTYKFIKGHLKRGFFDGPVVLDFVVECYPNPSIWTDLYSELPPVCVRNKQREIVEVQLDPCCMPINPRGHMVFIPMYSEQFGYNINGHGYFEASVKNPLGGNLDLVWMFDVACGRFIAPDEMKKPSMPLIFTHSVAGRTVKFESLFELEHGRIRSRHLIINYNNYAVAKASITEAVQYGVSVLAGK